MNENRPIVGNLVHLGSSMWQTRYDTLLCEDREWKAITDRMAERGYNLILIDIGEGVAFASHPEIAAKGAWSVEKLRGELQRLRAMGLEPIPKLNFSAAHDAWLGEYARMLSTPGYYAVCEDLIRECAEIFDCPRFFHFGFDEEDLWCHTGHDFVAIRQGELWWHDFLWFVKTVEKTGMRPWMWSDYIWEHRDEFLKRCPKSVLQSNWYYDNSFNDRGFRWPRLLNSVDLDRHGFDQIPTCSNYTFRENAAGIVTWSRANLSRQHHYGFLQSSWRQTTAAFHDKNFEAIDLLADALMSERLRI